jgi:hypothetical protein
MAQLHGDEDADYCARVGPERVIKALRVGKDFDPQDVLRYPAAAVLLDAFDGETLMAEPAPLPTGKSRKKPAQLRRVFLAGGTRTGEHSRSGHKGRAVCGRCQQWRGNRTWSKGQRTIAPTDDGAGEVRIDL